MTKIERMIKIHESNKCVNLKNEGFNPTLFWALRDQRLSGNELIDFNDVIWDYDIPEIAAAFDEAGIKEFTVSSTFSGLIETLAAFEEYGFKLNGITTVKGKYIGWTTGEQMEMKAVRMIKA